MVQANQIYETVLYAQDLDAAIKFYTDVALRNKPLETGSKQKSSFDGMDEDQVARSSESVKRQAPLADQLISDVDSR